MSKSNTITHRPISKRYKDTDIMHVIGKQSEPMKLYMENETCREEIETILSAPGHNMTTLALDMFALGMMYGKRAERSKRKDPWTKEGRNIKLTLHCVPLPETVKGVAVKKAGKVKIKGNNITLSADAGNYALADMGTRPQTMVLECDVKLDDNGIAGFAFGGSEADPSYTALCLNAGEDLVHYEGTEIQDLEKYGPEAYTKFDFSKTDTHHVTLVCENEIVVLYIDDTKALSSRIRHSVDGAHIGVFSYGCGASFENITVKLPN